MFDKHKQYAFVMEYEKETTTYEVYQPTNSDAPRSLVHEVSQMPTVSREKVSVGINADGTSEWTITEQDPKHPMVVKNECLPDNTPKTHITKISGGQATYYDINGNLLHTETVKIPSFKNFIEKIKNNGGKPDCNGNRPNKSGDVTIETVNDRTSRYTKIINAADNMPGMIGYKTESIVDNYANKLYSTLIYDLSGNIIFSNINKYDDNSEFPMPVFTQIESLSKDSQGEDYTMITTEQTENIQITDNLN
jgi:hypothetical protein